MKLDINGQKRELVTWSVAIVTIINAVMVWLAASGDYPGHSTPAHYQATAAHGEPAPMADVQPQHAAAPLHDPALPQPAEPAMMTPGMELRPMVDPGLIPPAMEREKAGH